MNLFASATGGVGCKIAKILTKKGTRGNKWTKQEIEKLKKETKPHYLEFVESIKDSLDAVTLQEIEHN